MSKKLVFLKFCINSGNEDGTMKHFTQFSENSALALKKKLEHYFTDIKQNVGQQNCRNDKTKIASKTQHAFISYIILRNFSKLI